MNSYLIWSYQWVRGELLTIPGRVIALCFFVFLFIFPSITDHPYALRVLNLSAIFAIFAASWDVLGGFAGLISLGHALFFGVAAYSAALLNIHFGFPPWVTIPIAAIIAVMVGLVACFPTLRLRGFYLSLVTLAYPLILAGVVLIFDDFTGGELGLFGIARLSNSRFLDYYIILVIMVGSVFAMWKFTDAKSKVIRTGVVLYAIREDEITARASGIDTPNYRLLAFAVSGFFAGIAGGLYAHFIRISGPSTLELFFSFQPILWSIFGGLATIYGAVVGVYILYPLLEILRLSFIGNEIRLVVFALILIFTLLFMPEGISVWILDKIEVVCPRCKVINITTRSRCRACDAPLHLP